MAQHKTILCIDDDPEILGAREGVLRSNGYAVISASSGREGLAVVSDGRSVDLVILDYELPDINGDLVAERLKANHPLLPIVLISGFDQLPASLLEKVTAFLPKGRAPEVLLATVKNILSPTR